MSEFHSTFILVILSFLLVHGYIQDIKIKVPISISIGIHVDMDMGIGIDKDRY